MLIPKNIIQCHTKGAESFNEEERSAICKLKYQNPSWSFLFFNLITMRSFIKENYSSRYLNAFDMINPEYGASITDYFRYLSVYKLGGVYMDNKAYTDRPLSSIIRPEDEMIIFTWGGNPRGLYSERGIHKEIDRGDEFQQWNIISTKANKHLSCVIENVTSNIENYSINEHGVGSEGTLRTTGPVVFTNTIDSVYDGTGIRFAGNNEVNGVIYRDDISFPARDLSEHYGSKTTPIVMHDSHV